MIEDGRREACSADRIQQGRPKRDITRSSEGSIPPDHTFSGIQGNITDPAQGDITDVNHRTLGGNLSAAINRFREIGINQISEHRHECRIGRGEGRGEGPTESNSGRRERQRGIRREDATSCDCQVAGKS